VITGIVTPFREAVLDLTVRGPAGQVTVAAVIDTGYTDYLTLLPNHIALLGLPLGGSVQATLADGSRVTLSLYRADVLWDGQWRPVAILAATGDALIGMALLHGFRLQIDVLDGGPVTIEAIP
jgi:clan AA aspartic protease